MKRIRQHITITLCAGLSLLAGCNQLSEFAGGTQTQPKTAETPTSTTPETPPAGGLLGLEKTELVNVNAQSTLIRGSGREGAIIANRNIQLSPYSIGKYEVTRELWVEVMSVLYDDLQQNGNFFKDEITSKGVRRFVTATKIDPNEPGLTPWQKKSIKASKFVEYMGSDVFGVGGDLITVYDSKSVLHVTSYNHMFQMSKEEILNYFSEANKHKPMGYVQWHEAVVFLNYLSILSGLMPAYQLDRFMAWHIGGDKRLTKFGTDLDYHWGGDRWGAGTSADRGSPDKRYIRPRLYLPLQETMPESGASGFRREWKAWDPTGSRPIESFILQAPAEMHPFAPVKNRVTGFAAPGTEEFETALEAARRNPVSWMKDQYWLEALPSAETRPVEKGDHSATFPRKYKQEYTLRDVLRNQRITFDQLANGFRLPTEVEWEFAARGANQNAGEWNSVLSGGSSMFTGGTPNPQTQVANFSGEAIEVGLLKPNSLGIYDMSGNLAEWVFDMKNGAEGVWTMTPFKPSGAVQHDPYFALSNLESKQMYWTALERIIRGASYADPENVRNMLTRMTRNRPYSGDIARDGYYISSREDKGRVRVGVPHAQEAPKAAAQQGFRIARNGS